MMIVVLAVLSPPLTFGFLPLTLSSFSKET